MFADSSTQNELPQNGQSTEHAAHSDSGPQTSIVSSPGGTINKQSHGGLDGLYLASRFEGVDGMGNIGVMEDSYPEHSSSTASFMAQVKNAMAARLSSSVQRHTVAPLYNDSVLNWTDPKQNHREQSIAQLFVLPPRRIANDMMDTYWNEIHVLYPFFMRDRLMQRYQKLWTGEEGETEQRLVYCIINLIFALSCQIKKRDSPDEMATAAVIFYKRAAQLLQFNVIGGGSVELVQSLLLMGQYLQSTEWPHRCWVVIGLAIRISQSLGLHMTRMTDSLRQPDRQLARRLWHGCVFMDRMVSMTFGRPMMISRADALATPFPDAIDDESLVNERYQPQSSEKLSRNEFFVQSLRLYIITQEILSEMYQNENTTSTGPPGSSMEKLRRLDFNAIVKIDSEILSWYNAVPEALKINPSPANKSDSQTILRQANILRLRCLQVRILLLRPILSLVVTQSVRSHVMALSRPEECLSLAIGMICARKCIVSALEVIDIIYENQSDEGCRVVEPLPAWWFEVFCKCPSLYLGIH